MVHRCRHNQQLRSCGDEAGRSTHILRLEDNALLLKCGHLDEQHLGRRHPCRIALEVDDVAPRRDHDAEDLLDGSEVLVVRPEQAGKVTGLEDDVAGRWTVQRLFFE